MKEEGNGEVFNLDCPSETVWVNFLANILVKDFKFLVMILFTNDLVRWSVGQGLEGIFVYIGEYSTNCLFFFYLL